MASIVNEYVLLLIKQYWGQTRANAEITARATIWQGLKDAMEAVEAAFIWWEPDELGAYNGAVLDLIGKIVGQGRVVGGAELSDEDYVLYLEARIAANNASAYAWSDERITLQDVVVAVSGGQAYVTDLQRMTIVVTFTVDIDALVMAELRDTGLLPKPQGVRIQLTQVEELDGAFGFAENPRCVGFADKMDPSVVGGPFAERIL